MSCSLKHLQYLLDGWKFAIWYPGNTTIIPNALVAQQPTITIEKATDEPIAYGFSTNLKVILIVLLFFVKKYFIFWTILAYLTKNS